MALMVKLKLPNRVQPDVLPPPGMCGTHTNKLHYIKKYLLDELPTKPFAPDFMQPVDTEVLQVPTYYTIIQCPMDVGTIIKRVQNRFYHGVDELIIDFRQVISNCYKFNRPNDTVYRNGQKLEKFFLKILSQMPEGDEIPSYKDPRAPRSPPEEEKASAVTEQQCREDLKKLQNEYVEGVDGELRDFFKDKWTALSKKLSKHQFKSVEEFHLHIDGIFLQYKNQAKRIYENTFYESLDNISYQPVNKELNELLYETKKAEGSLREPYNSHSKWQDTLVNGLDATIERLRNNLDTCRLNEEEKSAGGEGSKKKPKMRTKVRGEDRPQKLNTLMNTLEPNSPDNKDTEIENFSEVERRAIQQQFVMLPLNSKIEIMHIIAQTEDINTENCDLQWFDIKNFGVETLHLMKKAMHPHTKLNLRNMKPAEKEDLQRSLENRLRNINQVLNGNRRKYTHRMRIRSTVQAKKRSRLEAKAVSGSGCGSGKSFQAVGAGTSKQRVADNSSDSDSSDSSDSSSSDSDSSSDSSDSSSDSKESNVLD
ncbi:bromodomain testis-specific protein [Drosophila innubila]|uniref:bromodomain testis-specific protein n=1 Tax=Drosophila innubila TaxID=198719 RepID=UPI00148DF8F7|nr:bromodomain testis-specific protein [Drosophila innubila]